MKYVLRWFEEDDLMGEQELVGVTPEMVKQWFNLGEDDAPVCCYPVFEQSHLIQPYFMRDRNVRNSGAFNFGRYDYFLEGEQDFPGEQVDAQGRTINEAPVTG